MFSLSCIKCKTSYQSEDEEPYYCGECLAVRNKIAKEVDAKLALRPKKEVPLTALQQYDLVRGKSPFPLASKMFG